MNSKYVFLWVTVTISLSNVGLSQTILGLSSANECRHSAILSMNPNETLYTVRCHIPPVDISNDKYDILRAIPKDWHWVFSSKGSISGQVIVREKNGVYMISQKHCVDKGRANGRQMRRVYNKVALWKSNSSGTEKNRCKRSISKLSTEENSKNEETCLDFSDKKVAVEVAGDFNTLQNNGDAYADCVENKTPWDEFKLLNSFTAEEQDDNEMKQYLLVHMGGHGGIGFSLVPYNFSYDQVKLQDTFKANLKKIYADSDSHYYEDRVLSGIKSEEPIVLHRYPFETGLTILGKPRELDGYTGRPKEFCNVLNDTASLAWHRAFQAKNALSRAQHMKSENQKHLDSVGMIIEGVVIACQVIISFGITILAYNATTSIKFHEQGRSVQNGHQRFVDNADLRDCFSFQDSYIVLVEFIGALLFILLLVKQTYISKYWYRESFEVTQGGLITYGNIFFGGANENVNVLANKEFVVSHWINVRAKSNGYKLFNNAANVILVVFIITVMTIFRKVSKSRQLQLHLLVIQWIVFIVSWPLEMLICPIERFLATCCSLPTTYESLFQSVCKRLCSFYDKAQLPTRYEESVQARYHLGYSEDRNLSFAANYLTFNTDPITRNEIEKAAEVLSAEYHGRLSLMQSLTIMCDSDLSNTIDRFRQNTRCGFSVAEIKNLAIVYYVREIILSHTRNRTSSNNMNYQTIQCGAGMKKAALTSPDIATVIEDGRVKEYAIVQLNGSSYFS